MITFKEYGDRYAKAKGFNCFEDIYRIGLIAGEIEEFTKGYAKLILNEQKSQILKKVPGFGHQIKSVKIELP